MLVFIRNWFDVKLWRKICIEASIEVSLLAENWKFVLAGLVFQVPFLMLLLYGVDDIIVFTMFCTSASSTRIEDTIPLEYVAGMSVCCFHSNVGGTSCFDHGICSFGWLVILLRNQNSWI